MGTGHLRVRVRGHHRAGETTVRREHVSWTLVTRRRWAGSTGPCRSSAVSVPLHTLMDSSIKPTILLLSNGPPCSGGHDNGQGWTVQEGGWRLWRESSGSAPGTEPWTEPGPG